MASNSVKMANQVRETASEIEVVNLLHGTSGKIMYDRGMTMEQLRSEIHTKLGVQEDHQLVFSPASPHSLSPHSLLSPDQLAELMEQCGASRGNGMLYLLPTRDLGHSKTSDLSCLTQLRFAVSDQQRCMELITDHNYSNEIVQEINLLKSQQLRQESGVREFRKFCRDQFQSFRDSRVYQQMTRRGVATSARLSLAVEWLASDLEAAGNSSHGEAQRVLQSMKQLKAEVEQVVMEIDTLYISSEQQLSSTWFPKTREEAIESATAELAKSAKMLPELRKVEMHGRCQDILRKCEEMARQAGERTSNSLSEVFTSLASTWQMKERSQQLAKLCQDEEILSSRLLSLATSRKHLAALREEVAALRKGKAALREEKANRFAPP